MSHNNLLFVLCVIVENVKTPLPIPVSLKALVCVSQKGKKINLYVVIQMIN